MSQNDDELEPVDLPDKYPDEIVSYTLSALPISTIAQGLDYISAAVFSVYLESDATMASLPGWIGSAATFTPISATAPLVGTGSDSLGTYILKASVTCPSGRVYVLKGRFSVANS